MLENAIDPATGQTSGGELVYCANTVGPDGTFVPGHVERCPDTSGPWAVGTFDHTLLADSPGASNLCLTPPGNDECLDAFVAVDGANAVANASATESAEPWDFDDGSGGCAGGAGAAAHRGDGETRAGAAEKRAGRLGRLWCGGWLEQRGRE